MKNKTYCKPVMKQIVRICLFILMFYLGTGGTYAQDTVIFISGKIEVVNIIESGPYGVKHSKLGTDQRLDYKTIPKNEIKEIRYSEGIIEPRPISDRNDGVDSKKEILRNKFSLSIGASTSVMNSYKRGNIDEYWQIWAVPGDIPDKGKNIYFALNISGVGQVVNEKNYFGLDIEYIVTNSQAIKGSYQQEYWTENINFYARFYRGSLIYMRSLDKKGRFLIALEPGLIAVNSYGGIYNDVWEPRVFLHLGAPGAIIATGLNARLFSGLDIKLRAGYRAVSAPATYYNENSVTGFSIASINKESVYIDWSGAFITAGLSFDVPVIR